MKKYLTTFVFLLSFFGINAQSFIGAWEATSASESGESIKNIVIFTEGYQVSTWFHAETGEFISTNGGTWKLDGDTMTEMVEFNTVNPETVGKIFSFTVSISEDSMGIADNPLVWKRIDNGLPGKLQGAWLMSGRVRNGEIQKRDTNQPRKTMKILSGTRFQWIAYNTETKEFMGTGGGTYTTANGNYTENIEFFSRDNSRVGASLKFDYELINGDWNHSGLSSKGDPIHEIWSIRSQ